MLYKTLMKIIIIAFWFQALTPENIQGDWGATKLGPGVTPMQGFGIEFVSTFVLVLIIFGATDDNRNDVKGSAPLAIGLCVGCLVMFGVS